MFISFEGVDGSGKTTQARLLAEALRARVATSSTPASPAGHLSESGCASFFSPARP